MAHASSTAAAALTMVEAHGCGMARDDLVAVVHGACLSRWSSASTPGGGSTLPNSRWVKTPAQGRAPSSVVVFSDQGFAGLMECVVGDVLGRPTLGRAGGGSPAEP